MKNTVSSWRLFALCILIVSLDVYVEFGILSEDCVTPLADGMTVMVIGSGDSTNDGMVVWGGTNYIAASTLGDDVILATVTISSNDSGVAGGFFATISYESDDIDYVYIRFFNAPPGALTSMVYWGTSSVFQLGVTLGVSTVDFNPGNDLKTTNYNNFVVIPEPSTANLFVMMAGMLWAMRSKLRRDLVNKKT
jgi:hypothetical protein